MALNPAHAGPFGLDPFNLTVVNDHVVFNGSADTGSPFLFPVWVSDGTDAGTDVLLPTTTAVAQLFPQRRTVDGDTLYFGAQAGAANGELWRTDGTAAGTARVFAFGATGFAFIPSELAVSGGTVYLNAADLANGQELWATDGTAAGTRLVTDLNTNTVGSTPTELTDADGRLFFTADGGSAAPRARLPEIWKSNGTTNGTRLVDTPFPAEGATRFDGPMQLTAMGRKVFFTSTEFPQLWVTNGRPGGTQLLRDFSSNSGSSARRRA